MASKKEKTVFKKHKALDKVYHPESGLVIKSPTDKVVVGRISDDEFISLDDECLELCEKYGFKYDESLVAEQESEENPEVEEKPEEEAEEEPEEEAEPEPKKKSKAKEPETKAETEEPQPEPKKKPKEDGKKAPEKPKGNDVMSELSSLVSSHSESLTAFVQTLLERSNESQDKCSKLEAEISTLKTQLEETKAKMKKFLSAMQNDL